MNVYETLFEVRSVLDAIRSITQTVSMALDALRKTGERPLTENGLQLWPQVTTLTTARLYAGMRM